MVFSPFEETKRHEDKRPKRIIQTPWVWVLLVFTLKCVVGRGVRQGLRCGDDPDRSAEVPAKAPPFPREYAMPHYEELPPAPAVSGVEGEIAGHPYRVLIADQDPDRKKLLAAAVREQASAIESVLASDDPESTLSRLNGSDEPLEVEREFIDALELAKHVYEASDGAFAPLVASGEAKSFKALKWKRLESGAYQLRKKTKGLEVRLDQLLTGLAADRLCEALQEAYAADYAVDVDGSGCAGGRAIQGHAWTFTVDGGFFAQTGGSTTRTFTLPPELQPVGIATAKGLWPNEGTDLVRITVLAPSSAEAQAWAIALATFDQRAAFELAAKADVAAYAVAQQGGRFLDRDTPAMAQRLQPATPP